MQDLQFLIRLRDCFTGGYTLPQFCIENNIRKPLFVAEGRFWQFFWEIYVQFHYDKRLIAQFCFIDAESTQIHFPAHPATIGELKIKNISEINFAEFDAIICLTTKKIFSSERIIYIDALTDYFIRKTCVEIPLLNFLQRFPRVKLFLTNYPAIYNYEGGVEFGRHLSKKNTGNIKNTLDQFGYTDEQILEISSTPEIKKLLDGSTILADTAPDSLLRIKDGKRTTVNQPEKFLNRIYFFGPCIHFGIYVPFNKTLESYLQLMLNEKNLPYRVENESQFYSNRIQDIFYNLNRLQPEPGDIIFVIIQNLNTTSGNIPFVDVDNAFAPPHDYREIFVDEWSHPNERGHKILAEKYFEFLTANNFFRDVEFIYPPPVNLFIDTVYRRNSSSAA